MNILPNPIITVSIAVATVIIIVTAGETPFANNENQRKYDKIRDVTAQTIKGWEGAKYIRKILEEKTKEIVKAGLRTQIGFSHMQSLDGQPQVLYLKTRLTGSAIKNYIVRWLLGLIRVEDLPTETLLQGYRVEILYDVVPNLLRWIFFAALAFIYL